MTISVRRLASLLAVTACFLPVAQPAMAQQCAAPENGKSFALNLVAQKNVPAPTGRYMTTIQVGNGPIRDAVVDTGSIGLVINNAGVDPQLYKASKQPAQMLYTSSMDYLWGRLVQSPISFVKPGNGAATVLGKSNNVSVTAVQCVCHATKGGNGGPAPAVDTVPNEKDCSKLNGKATTASGVNVTLDRCVAQDSTATAWMGVGFGRGKGGTGDSLADNPLVQIAGDNVHQGYVIAGDSINVGLTASNTQGYTAIALNKNSNNQWDEAHATISLEDTNSGKNQPYTTPTGAMLMDVGIDFIIVNTPQNTTLSTFTSKVACKPVDGHYDTIVTPGTSMTVNLLSDNQQTVKSYKVTAKDPCSSSSEGVVAVISGQSTNTSTPSAYNTGRSFIKSLNYMFDNQCGVLGVKTAETKAN